MSLTEIETLKRLRKHRADRAERALLEVKRLQRALQVQIEQAQEVLEQTRQQEALQSAQLLSQHQGQVVSLQQLKSWSAEEHKLSAGTRREEEQLHELHGQREAYEINAEQAQQQVTDCLRQVEKLRELSVLLEQEEV